MGGSIPGWTGAWLRSSELPLCAGNRLSVFAGSSTTMSCATIGLKGVSPGAPGTVAGPVTKEAERLAGYSSMRIEATLQGAQGGTLDVYLQVSYDNGASWSDYCHFATLAAGAAAVTYGASVTRGAGSLLAVLGKNLAPILAANMCRDGEWGGRARLLFVAGPGTSAGTEQVVRLFLSK